MQLCSSGSPTGFRGSAALIHVDIEDFVRFLGRGQGLQCILQVFPQLCETRPVPRVQLPAPGHQSIPRAAKGGVDPEREHSGRMGTPYDTRGELGAFQGAGGRLGYCGRTYRVVGILEGSCKTCAVGRVLGWARAERPLSVPAGDPPEAWPCHLPQCLLTKYLNSKDEHIPHGQGSVGLAAGSVEASACDFPDPLGKGAMASCLHLPRVAMWEGSLGSTPEGSLCQGIRALAPTPVKVAAWPQLAY